MNYTNKNWLEHKYLREKLNMYQIAKICNCSPANIWLYLKRFDIPRRKGGVEHWSEKQKEFRRIWNLEHPEIQRMKGKKHSEETKMKMSLSRQGFRNGNWKGGLTFTIRNFRKSIRYQNWRKQILKRDNFICQFENCSNKNNIEIHHILSAKDYPDLILDIDNGITVCNYHHKKIHKLRKMRKHES